MKRKGEEEKTGRVTRRERREDIIKTMQVTKEKREEIKGGKTRGHEEGKLYQYFFFIIQRNKNQEEEVSGENQRGDREGQGT